MNVNFEDSSDDDAQTPGRMAPGSSTAAIQNPLNIDWLPLSEVENQRTLAISSLPGCRFRSTWRNLENDIKTLKEASIKEVFVLCTLGELRKYRVPTLLAEYQNAGIVVHHWPILDGTVPAMDDLLHLLQDMQLAWNTGTKTLIHCYGGLGRACLVVACLLLDLDKELQPEVAIEILRDLRGPSAVQTVKQYNFIFDFRKLRNIYLKESFLREPTRSLSR